MPTPAQPPGDLFAAFVALPPSAQAEVLRDPSLYFSAYPRRLASALEQSPTVGDRPIPELMWGWMSLYAPPGSPAAQGVARAVARAYGAVAPSGSLADDLRVFNNSDAGRQMGVDTNAAANAAATQYTANQTELARQETLRQNALVNGISTGITGIVGGALGYAAQQHLADVQEQRVQLEHAAAMARIDLERGNAQASQDLARIAIRLQANAQAQQQAQLAAQQAAQQAQVRAPSAPPAADPPSDAPMPTWAKALLGGAVVVAVGAAGVAIYRKGA